MRRALLAAAILGVLVGCGGSEDPAVVEDARDFAERTLDNPDRIYDPALEGDWTRVGTKVVFTQPERRCDDDTVDCSPLVVVVCLRGETPASTDVGTVEDRISELACRAR